MVTRVLLAHNTRTRTMGPHDPDCNGIVEAAGVMILQKHEDGDSVILVGIPEKGKTVFGEPGGLVDLNNNGFPVETPRQAAERETVEETRGTIVINPMGLMFLGYLDIPNRPGHHYALYGYEVDSEFKCRSFHGTAATKAVRTHTESGANGWNESTALVRVFLDDLRFISDRVNCDNFGTVQEIPVTKRFQACVRKAIATGFLPDPHQG
jgi:ADP-ribose pyrophosphatase YjhB (NUDIX family)